MWDCKRSRTSWSSIRMFCHHMFSETGSERFVFRARATPDSECVKMHTLCAVPLCTHPHMYHYTSTPSCMYGLILSTLTQLLFSTPLRSPLWMVKKFASDLLIESTVRRKLALFPSTTQILKNKLLNCSITKNLLVPKKKWLKKISLIVKSFIAPTFICRIYLCLALSIHNKQQVLNLSLTLSFHNKQQDESTLIDQTQCM